MALYYIGLFRISSYLGVFSFYLYLILVFYKINTFDHDNPNLNGFRYVLVMF